MDEAQANGTPLPSPIYLGARMLRALVVAVLLVAITDLPGLALRPGLQAGFLGSAFSWTDVLVVAAWGLGGMLLAVRFFSWEPRA